jgi:hypothetical protein
LWPYTEIEWVNLVSVSGQTDPIPGASISLSNYNEAGGGIRVLKGIQGFDAPSFQIIADELPAIDGAVLRSTRAASRNVFIPIAIWGSTRQDFLNIKRDLLSRMNPNKGLGRIRVTEPDGASRFLTVSYVSGAEGDYGRETGGMGMWQTLGLNFQAFDPYWYANDDIVIEFGQSDFVPFLDAPFFGLRLNEAAAINQAVPIESRGDVDTWPTFLITGPAVNLNFQITGPVVADFTINATVPFGQYLYVDTRPLKKKILLVNNPNVLTGQNLWSKLANGDTFWPISPLEGNVITISATGMNTNSAVTMVYRPRYYSA